MIVTKDENGGYGSDQGGYQEDQGGQGSQVGLVEHGTDDGALLVGSDKVSGSLGGKGEYGHDQKDQLVHKLLLH